MAQLNINISDELQAKIQVRAAESGAATIEQYVEQLIRDDAESVDYGAPEHLSVKTREQLKALLQEGLNSPAREITTVDWEEKKRGLIERHGRAKAG